VILNHKEGFQERNKKMGSSQGRRQLFKGQRVMLIIFIIPQQMKRGEIGRAMIRQGPQS